eukprot:1520353-Amphidinium_carterae.1
MTLPSATRQHRLIHRVQTLSTRADTTHVQNHDAESTRSYDAILVTTPAMFDNAISEGNKKVVLIKTQEVYRKSDRRLPKCVALEPPQRFAHYACKWHDPEIST